MEHLYTNPMQTGTDLFSCLPEVRVQSWSSCSHPLGLVESRPRSGRRGIDLASHAACRAHVERVLDFCYWSDFVAMEFLAQRIQIS